MEQREIERRIREIRRGQNVVENVVALNVYISELRIHAEKDKDLQPSVRKILHKDANEIDKELFFALDAFFKLDYEK